MVPHGHRFQGASSQSPTQLFELRNDSFDQFLTGCEGFSYRRTNKSKSDTSLVIALPAPTNHVVYDKIQHFLIPFDKAAKN